MEDFNKNKDDGRVYSGQISQKQKTMDTLHSKSIRMSPQLCQNDWMGVSRGCRWVILFCSHDDAIFSAQAR